MTVRQTDELTARLREAIRAMQENAPAAVAETSLA
jgi:hypothetical protein